MKKIFYVYRTARSKILENIKKGLEPDHFLYGYNYLQKRGYQVEFSDIAYSKWNILKWVFFPVEQLIIKITSLGFKIDQAILLYPKYKNSDLIITTVDSAGLPILFLKYLRLIQKPVIFISVGLINELAERRTSLIAKFYRKILSQADKIICYSKIEQKNLIKFNPELKNKVHFIPFGVDANFFKLTRSQNKDFIVSIGRDRSRDYQMLAELAKINQKLKFRIVTSPSNVKGLNFSKNVKIYYDLSYSEVRKLLNQSKLIFLPLKEISRASGQIAFLEALAVNKKIVVANIKGIKQVYTSIPKTVFFYKASNFKDCVTVFKKALNSIIIKHRFSEKYTSEYYGFELEKIIRNIC